MRFLIPGRARFAALLLVVTALGCGGGGDSGGSTGPGGPVLTTISVFVVPSTLTVGQSVTATATGADQNGGSLALSNVTWSSSNTSVATVNQTGTITAVGGGSATITATSGSKSGEATISVLTPVATISVTPPMATLSLGATQQMTAATFDAAGNPLPGRTVTWSSSDPTKAVVTLGGLVTALSPGNVSIIATSEGRTGSAAITVSAGGSGDCTTATAMQLTVGSIKTLTAAQVASLCIGGLTASSEYVIIPFNNSTSTTNTVPITMTSSNTITVTDTPDLASQLMTPMQIARMGAEQNEIAFRKKEATMLASMGLQRSRGRLPTADLRPGISKLTGVPANPTVGSIVQLNADLTSDNTCTTKTNHAARVVAVFPHTIVFVDTLAPTQGYTDAELSAFGATFDTLGFALDTANFGGPSDIDGNGRVGIFFTQGVNVIPVPPGTVILGLFAGRDLLPVAPPPPQPGCPGSNEGEMFYVPVPDVNRTLNGLYTNKANLANGVLGTLVHEFQHLINQGRRLYVNPGVTSLQEDVWLNEGLSHIAEELLYYRQSGLAPRSNLGRSDFAPPSDPTGSIFFGDEGQNISRLRTYLFAPSANSPYSPVDVLPMRGAIWQLLRYSADRKGGDEKATWFALENSPTSGQANFNAVFGNIVTNTHDWAIAQFVDDDGFTVDPKFTNPSWNFRNVFLNITFGGAPPSFPLVTNPLPAATPINFSVVGGGAAYVRFGIAPSTVATIVSLSSGTPVPANMDFTIVRTK